MTEITSHRQTIEFQGKPCMVISADKAKGDAKNLREAAKHCPPKIAAWLIERAAQYESMDNG